MLSDCLRSRDQGEALDAALLALPAFTGAGAAAVVHRATDGSLDVPAAWREDDFDAVTAHDLPGHAGTLVLGWRGEPRESDELEVALLTLDTTLARHQVQQAYDDLVARVDNAQHLADMGDYDWDIANDTIRWSDQLFRIYGHEPQSFTASYEHFIEMIHPEDRERIMAVHQESFHTGEPYHMVERILRPDGEVRHLATNGQVLVDESGAPLRFRGTCLDITDQVLAEQERERLATHMVESRLRRRQALELNDSVVQGLATASYALQLGDVEQAVVHVSRTLSAARNMMGDLLQPMDGGPLGPGDLLRSAPAALPAEGPPSDVDTMP